MTSISASGNDRRETFLRPFFYPAGEGGRSCHSENGLKEQGVASLPRMAVDAMTLREKSPAAVLSFAAGLSGNATTSLTPYRSKVLLWFVLLSYSFFHQ